MEDIRIIGAGLAGLLAACKWPAAKIIEQRPQHTGPNHKALLRFRTDAVSKLTGIPFRQVRVDKGIWDGSRHYSECNVGFANAYSEKVLGKFTGGRSIWNLNHDYRYVAPHDFEQQLLDRIDTAERRVEWGLPVWRGDFQRDTSNVTISTMPMDKMLDLVDHNYPVENVFKFEHNAVFVRRYKLPEGTDLFQTLYFVDPNTAVYRASITGEVLIIEEVQRHWDCTWSGTGDGALEEKGAAFDNVLKAFGMRNVSSYDVQFIDSKYQPYGKIVTLPKIDRESIMYELTREYNIYSLGRFATWRNVLLDDLIGDMDFIDRLIRSSAYQRHQIVNRAASSEPSWLAPSSDDVPF